jgi:hypothetical protein
VYGLLAQRYGWTPQQVADMTPAQQLYYVTADSSGRGDRVKFSSRAEAQRYLKGQ